MRAVIIDPRQRRVVLVPHVEDPHRLAMTRVGEDHSWSICQGESGEQPGLLLCTETRSIERGNQRFFRLMRCTTTFAGPCVFTGHLDGLLRDVPEWFWREVTSKVLWLPEDTALLGFMQIRTLVTCPESGRRTEEGVSRAVFGREGDRGYMQ